MIFRLLILFCSSWGYFTVSRQNHHRSFSWLTVDYCVLYLRMILWSYYEQSLYSCWVLNISSVEYIVPQGQVDFECIFHQKWSSSYKPKPKQRIIKLTIFFTSRQREQYGSIPTQIIWFNIHSFQLWSLSKCLRNKGLHSMVNQGFVTMRSINVNKPSLLCQVAWRYRMFFPCSISLSLFVCMGVSACMWCVCVWICIIRNKY